MQYLESDTALLLFSMMTYARSKIEIPKELLINEDRSDLQDALSPSS